MSGRLRWEIEGRDWPHRAASRFVAAGGLDWHVQVMGSGPTVLLLHGTGSTTHSWRGVMPLLAQRMAVIAIDLPGHGFTRGRVPGGPSLPGMARAIRRLLAALGEEPALLVGHSAGAAIALELARETPVPVAGFGAALMPFPGLAARLFPALAKLVFVNPFAPALFARIARQSGETARFLTRATESHIDPAGLRCYETVLGNSEHCAGALAMMANWDLAGLRDRLPRIAAPVVLAHGSRDPAIPLHTVEDAVRLLPDCTLEIMEGLGHLAHEERPAAAADLVLRIAASHAMAGP